MIFLLYVLHIKRPYKLPNTPHVHNPALINVFIEYYYEECFDYSCLE
jgi:hypothetical protein